jgi:hypothetical protein
MNKWCIYYRNITDGCWGIVGPFEDFNVAQSYLINNVDGDGFGKHFRDKYNVHITRMDFPGQFKW